MKKTQMAFLTLAVLSQGAMRAGQEEDVDLLIQGGRVVDGAGSPWMQADVAIRGDTIVAVGRSPVKARRTIAASGKVVCPGFIDMHAHSEYGLIVDPRALSKVTQGVTTEVLGEHLSAGPVLGKAEDDPMLVAPPIERDWTTLGEFFDKLRANGIGVNVLSYVGSGQVRASVVGYENRPASPDELQTMKKLVAEAMEDGAFGLSSGMAYIPNAFATTDELIELAGVAAAYGGLYVTHLRSGIEGLREGITIAREAGLPVHIHHLNSTSSSRIKGYVAEIEKARAQGVDITGNVYPYIAGWTYLRSLLPNWVLEGGNESMLRRLGDEEERLRILEEMREAEAQRPRWARTFVSSYNPDVDGLSIIELGRQRGVPPEEGLVELLIEQQGEGFQISFGNTEEYLREALRQPWVAIGSDGSALSVGMRTALGKPHPRSFGTHPRVLAKYVREEKLLTLEEAIRKMTSLPAERLGLADRGLLRPGMKADVVVFDEERVQDLATFEKPEQYARGVEWVLVNGTAVVEEGAPTGALPGKVLTPIRN
ncbi:MAG: amidohydrolase family protein [Acidobacteriota bacterium]